ncbi:MAG: Holo-[acyl-carrier-protein] synthase [Actinomycetota bacterium]
MIKGIGVDVVDIARFAESLARTPGMRERLFTESELSIADETHPSFLAGRFAAKEALAKALGVPEGLAGPDVNVHRADNGAPIMILNGIAKQRAGSGKIHLSISHDGPVVVAMIVIENARG